MIFYVYVYFNPMNEGEPEPFYVGKGSGNRYLIHLNENLQKKDRNKLKVHILEKIKKAGLEPIIKKVFESDDEEAVKQVEIELIAKYGRRDLGKGSLANLTDGGEGSAGAIQDDEARRKKSIVSIKAHADLEIKKRRTEALRATLAKPEVKKKYSEIAREIGSRPEVKRKKSESMSGANHYNAKAVEVSGVKYQTVQEAAKVLGIDQRTLKKREDFKFLEKE